MEFLTTDINVTAACRLGAIDLTDDLRRHVKDSGVQNGLAVASTGHTTCGLLLNEWETGFLDDLRARLDALAPLGAYYAHDDLTVRTENLVGPDEPRNGHAHVAHALLGAANHSIPVRDGELLLGQWQRLIFIELDEPRPRRVTLSVMGACG